MRFLPNKDPIISTHIYIYVYIYIYIYIYIERGSLYRNPGYSLFLDPGVFGSLGCEEMENFAGGPVKQALDAGFRVWGFRGFRGLGVTGLGV